MCDAKGDMICDKWESIATRIVNSKNEELRTVIEQVVKSENIELGVRASVAIGYDTRSSSVRLCEACVLGMPESLVTVHNYGLVTTPQLHFLVHRSNQLKQVAKADDYATHFADAYRKISEHFVCKEKRRVIVDCANGVGALQLKKFQELLKDKIEFELVNTGEGKLNHLARKDLTI